MNASLDRLKEVFTRARADIGRVIIGQQEAIDMALITIFCHSHALIEGVPGVAKTLLVRTLGRVLNCPTGRIQFTPDLMPADITGTNIFNLRNQEFTLIRGPVFTAFLLADEINRAPAKTQSALLQAMQERAVTIDRERHALDPAFTVFATQNPVEYEGTYPLPEAQKDRFLMKITMDYPERDSEIELATRTLGTDAPEEVLDRDDIQPSIDLAELPQLRKTLDAVTVREELTAYTVDLVRASRSHEAILVGGGPRATQGLLLAARAHAALDGRDFVTPDDVRRMTRPVLEHRIVLRPEFEIEGVTIDEAIGQLFDTVTVPR